MKKPADAKRLFLATKRKNDRGPALMEGLPEQVKPNTRDPLDFDPTPESATAAILYHEAPFMALHGQTVHEPAVGAGHIARVLTRYGFKVRGGDVVDRGWGHPFCLGNYLESDRRGADIHFTNPPYNLINASSGGGAWLLHALKLGTPYIALLLNADWPAARVNGLDRILHDHPPSIEYLCCWKIDFRGGGSPPQRNSWFVWDMNRPAPDPNTWVRKRLYKDPPDPAQRGFDI